MNISLKAADARFREVADAGLGKLSASKVLPDSVSSEEAEALYKKYMTLNIKLSEFHHFREAASMSGYYAVFLRDGLRKRGVQV